MHRICTTATHFHIHTARTCARLRSVSNSKLCLWIVIIIFVYVSKKYSNWKKKKALQVQWRKIPCLSVLPNSKHIQTHRRCNSAHLCGIDALIDVSTYYHLLNRICVFRILQRPSCIYVNQISALENRIPPPPTPNNCRAPLLHKTTICIAILFSIWAHSLKFG